MTDMNAKSAMAARQLSVSRRGAMGAMSIAAVGAAAAANPAAALSSVAGLRLLTFAGAYPVAPGHAIDGYFAAPVGGCALDVVVIVPGPGTAPDKAQAAAQEQAMFGRFGVVPALPADAAARHAEVNAMLGHLRTMPHASGKVRVITV